MYFSIYVDSWSSILLYFSSQDLGEARSICDTLRTGTSKFLIQSVTGLSGIPEGNTNGF